MTAPRLEPPAVRAPRRRVHTRARLLETAADLFLTTGYARTTIEDVCATAGYTRGAFYSNFSAKEDLLLALFDQHATANLEELEELLADARGAGHPADPRDARLLALTLLQVSPEQHRWILLFLEFRLLATRSEEVAARLHAHDRAVADALARLLEDALPGAIPPGIAPGHLASVLLAAREGVLARAAGGGAVAEATLDAAAEVLASVLRAPERWPDPGERYADDRYQDPDG